MFETMLAAERLPRETQLTLLEVMEGRKDETGLARLAHLDGLDDEVDARLAKLPAMRVRTAWITRPGRKADEVRAMVRSERRVTVLVAIAELGVDSPELFAELAECPHLKVHRALVCNAAAPAEVRATATARVAADYRSLTYAQQSAVRQVWSQVPEICGPLLEVADLVATDGWGGELIRYGLAAPAATAAGRANVARYVAWRLARAVKADEGGHYGAASEVRHLLETVQSVAVRPWCDKRTLGALGRTVDVVAGLQARSVDQQQLAETRLVLAKCGDGGADPLADQAARAADVDDAGALALLEEMKSLPSRRCGTVHRALLTNDGLSVPVLRTVVARMDWTVLQGMSTAGLPVRAVAALCANGSVRNPRPAVVDELLAVLGDLPEADVERAVRHCVSPRLEDRQLMALPVRHVRVSLAYVDHQDRADIERRIGTLVAESLEGMPVTVFEQFAHLGRDFAGSTTQLLAVCKAAQA